MTYRRHCGPRHLQQLLQVQLGLRNRERRRQAGAWHALDAHDLEQPEHFGLGEVLFTKPGHARVAEVPEQQLIQADGDRRTGIGGIGTTVGRRSGRRRSVRRPPVLATSRRRVFLGASSLERSSQAGELIRG